MDAVNTVGREVCFRLVATPYDSLDGKTLEANLIARQYEAMHRVRLGDFRAQKSSDGKVWVVRYTSVSLP
jgi:hypothetical protein